MSDDWRFEWDPTKAAGNLVKHGVAFDVAKLVFQDTFALDWLDDRMDYGEARYVILGIAAGRLLYVAYTLRGETIRLISARGAEPYERRLYHGENG